MEIAGSMNAIAHNERFTYLHDSRTLYELDRTGNRLKKLFSCAGDTRSTPFRWTRKVISG